MENKVTAIIDILKQRYQDAPCALHYKKDYELMISVRLAAQCTDARVNLITPALFAAYPTLEAMAGADISHVESLVHSCGFYKHKARDIVLACQMLISDYGGKVPGTMEELLRIPGVGRKTANLLLGDLYSVPGSVVCDTHCIRICGRLGLSTSNIYIHCKFIQNSPPHHILFATAQDSQSSLTPNFHIFLPSIT